MPRKMKIRKLKLFYCQNNALFQAKELWRDMFLSNLSLLHESKNSVGLLVLNFRIWWHHVKTKNSMFYVPSQKIKLIKDKFDERASVCISKVNFLGQEKSVCCPY